MSDIPQSAVVPPPISRFASTRPGTPSLKTVVTYLIPILLPLSIPCQANIPSLRLSTSTFPISCVAVIPLWVLTLPLLAMVVLLNQPRIPLLPLLRHLLLK